MVEWFWTHFNDILVCWEVCLVIELVINCCRVGFILKRWWPFLVTVENLVCVETLENEGFSALSESMREVFCQILTVFDSKFVSNLNFSKPLKLKPRHIMKWTARGIFCFGLDDCSSVGCKKQVLNILIEIAAGGGRWSYDFIIKLSQFGWIFLECFEFHLTCFINEILSQLPYKASFTKFIFEFRFSTSRVNYIYFIFVYSPSSQKHLENVMHFLKSQTEEIFQTC